uniref:Uncharacterized protein n=1 Tax=Cucumis melo TaxID=3656 RepID=A0A9I9E8I1_CUCME
MLTRGEMGNQAQTFLWIGSRLALIYRISLNLGLLLVEPPDGLILISLFMSRQVKKDQNRIQVNEQGSVRLLEPQTVSLAFSKAVERGKSHHQRKFKREFRRKKKRNFTRILRLKKRRRTQAKGCVRMILEVVLFRGLSEFIHMESDLHVFRPHYDKDDRSAGRTPLHRRACKRCCIGCTLHNSRQIQIKKSVVRRLHAIFRSKLAGSPGGGVTLGVSILLSRKDSYLTFL